MGTHAAGASTSEEPTAVADVVVNARELHTTSTTVARADRDGMFRLFADPHLHAPDACAPVSRTATRRDSTNKRTLETVPKASAVRSSLNRFRVEVAEIRSSCGLVLLGQISWVP